MITSTSQGVILEMPDHRALGAGIVIASASPAAVLNSTMYVPLFFGP